MSKSKKVMCAGHICLDITPVFSQRPDGGLSALLTPGSLVHVGQPDIHLGGSVANTGLALRFFGADVSLACKVGNDEFGELVREKLAASGCETILSTDEKVGTSYSVVLALPEIDRIFLHDPGANETFCSDDIPDERLDGIDHFHFGYPPLMLGMHLDDGSELVRLFERVKSRASTTSLDMAAVDPASPAGKTDWEKILHKILPLTDFFLPSAAELCFMTDRSRYSQWLERANGGDVVDFITPEDIAPLASKLMDMGAKVVMIKCGGLGIYYRTGSYERLRSLCNSLELEPEKWCGQEAFEKSYRPDVIRSATGAGDTCISAFLTSMLQGRSISHCVKLAAAAGAMCVSSYDSLSALLPLNELEARITAGWEKVT